MKKENKKKWFWILLGITFLLWLVPDPGMGIDEALFTAGTIIAYWKAYK